MRLTPLVSFAAVALCSVTPARAQTELRLWPGGAPGSEQWSIPESSTRSPSGDRVIANVSEPTLTVFLPEAAIATGAAAVIAPGGALRVLGFDNEGVKVAEWLNERGIAAFVLKYRTLQHDPAAPRGPPPGMLGLWNDEARPSSGRMDGSST
jgi:acetyl esterase/lipase